VVLGLWCDEAVTRWVKTDVVAVVVVVAVAVAVAEQLFRRVADAHACSAFRKRRPPSVEHRRFRADSAAYEDSTLKWLADPANRIERFTISADMTPPLLFL
jgi:hypothetical protein